MSDNTTTKLYIDPPGSVGANNALKVRTQNSQNFYGIEYVMATMFSLKKFVPVELRICGNEVISSVSTNAFKINLSTQPGFQSIEINSTYFTSSDTSNCPIITATAYDQVDASGFARLVTVNPSDMEIKIDTSVGSYHEFKIRAQGYSSKDAYNTFKILVCGDEQLTIKAGAVLNPLYQQLTGM